MWISASDQMSPIPFLVLLVVLFGSTSVGLQESPPIVDTNSGRIGGKTILGPSGKAVDVFLGIPFAEPPIGHLRFRPPLEVKSWDGVFNATTPTPTCFQRKIPFAAELFPAKFVLPQTEMNEDCLKLNIWAPKKTGSNPTPVMVWIYGGAFSVGSISCTAFDGTVLATQEEVIVVTINFRQASLGFLYLEHPDVPGNAGLYDQLMALQWIKKNIGAFGGDQENITLFGHASGASSVGHHILSPLSKDLFQRAIMSSCSPTSEAVLLTKEKALEKSMFLVESLGCPHDRSNISTILQCLLSADPYDIVTSEQVRGEAMIFTHLPIVDGRFIVEHPRKALRERQFPKMNILMGNLKVESAVFLMAYDPHAFPLSPNTLPLDQRYFEESLKDLELDDGPLVRKVYEYVYLEKYKTYFEGMLMGFSDYIFVCPLNEFAELFSGGDIYRYVMPHHMAKAAPAPPWMEPVHSEEILLIFGDPLRNGHLYTEEEVAFSRRVMRYWANFARTGDPNSSPDKDDGTAIYWPRCTPAEKEYLVLAPNSTSVGHDHRKKYCSFWNDVRPALKQCRV